MMNDSLLYHEKVSSARTEALFIALTLLFFLLLFWRVKVARFDLLAGICLFLSCFFLFYAVNYRTLIIHLSSESLKLSFGIFKWNIPVHNIAECRLDHLPAVMRMGGAGIHFMFVRKRYRASFNFLEHPRVVIRFKRKAGWVQDLSFSTRHPKAVIHAIQGAGSAKSAA